jgi:hypothetical protein
VALLRRTPASLPLSLPDISGDYFLPDVRVMTNKKLSAESVAFRDAVMPRISEFEAVGRKLVEDLLPTAAPGLPEAETHWDALGRLASTGFAVAAVEGERGLQNPGQVDWRVTHYFRWWLGLEIQEKTEDFATYRLFSFFPEAAYFYARTNDLTPLRSIRVVHLRDA